MKLMGSGTVAHQHIPSLNGGTIKYHDRPYQLKDRAVVEHKQNKKFAPIHFKL
jgi:hypothetical protein